jgi:hypothetical protein
VTSRVAVCDIVSVQPGMADKLHVLAIVVFLQEPFLFVHQLLMKGRRRPGNVVSEGVVVEGKGARGE